MGPRVDADLNQFDDTDYQAGEATWFTLAATSTRSTTWPQRTQSTSAWSPCERELSISADGYSAGLNQTEQRPFGDDGGAGRGDKLHAWMAEARVENPAEVNQLTEARAFILGRNMFGPVRGEWDRQWNGWWGDDPPFHAPVFVLTHHPRDPQPMDGGTTYYFVTDGIQSALTRAREAAGDGDVSIHGGATTINQYLTAGLIDVLRLHIVPLTLGAGTRLFDGVPPLKLEQLDSRAANSVTHVTYRVLS